MENKITKVLGFRSLIIKLQIRKVTIRFSKMRAKEEQKQEKNQKEKKKEKKQKRLSNYSKKKNFHCGKSLNGKFK